MDLQKLQRILTKTNETLKTSSFSLMDDFGETPCDNETESILSSVKCHGCDDARRQNYQLKQQLCEYEERESKLNENEKEILAMKELYDLKCQEVELLRKELRAQKLKTSSLQQKINEFCQNSVETMERKLKELESGTNKNSSY